MSLTFGTGPLAKQPGGAFNFGLDDAPANRIFFEAFPRRVRAVVAGRVVLDSTRGKLLHESGYPARLYVPLEDLDAEVLERTATSWHCPFKGDASYWSVSVGGVTREDAVWAYEEPLEEAAWLAGHASLMPGEADAWYVEDDRVYGHFRDPYHRVDVFDSSRPVVVRVGGREVARSDRPKLLYETSLPVRPYVPAHDIDQAALERSEKRAICPYKGESTYWNVAGTADAAWSYESPLPDALRVQGHFAFDGDDVEVELGEPAERFTL